MSVKQVCAVVYAIASSAFPHPARAAAQPPGYATQPPRAAAQPPPDALQPTGYATNGDSALAALLAEALEGNPRVRQAFHEYRAAGAGVPQAAALPDPTLSFTQHLRAPETRVGPQFSSLSVSQSFPWFGTLSDRRKLAETEAAARGESLAERRAEIVLQVKLAYYDLAFVDRALAIADEERQLLLHYETLARARYSQGFGQQQEVLKLQAEVTRVLSREQELRRQRRDYEVVLNVLAGRAVEDPVPPVAIAPPPAAAVHGERLQAVGVAARPEVRSTQLRIEGARQAIGLSRRRYRPGFTVGVAWGNVLGRRDLAGRATPPPDDGRDTYSLTFGASIPVFRSSYDAGVREAAARLAAAEEAHRDAVDAVVLAVRSSAFRLETIEEQLDLFERALLPQAEQALRATEEAYSAGVAGVLELLDSEETLLDVRHGLARLRADYMKALAEMERAIGSAFPEETSAGRGAGA